MQLICINLSGSLILCVYPTRTLHHYVGLCPQQAKGKINYSLLCFFPFISQLHFERFWSFWKRHNKKNISLHTAVQYGIGLVLCKCTTGISTADSFDFSFVQFSNQSMKRILGDTVYAAYCLSLFPSSQKKQNPSDSEASLSEHYKQTYFVTFLRIPDCKTISCRHGGPPLAPGRRTLKCCRYESSQIWWSVGTNQEDVLPPPKDFALFIN